MEPRTVYLSDYQPPAFLISEVELCVELLDHEVRVNSKLSFKRNPAAGDTAVFELNGKKINLISISINGNALTATQYELNSEKLSIFNPPNQGYLEISNTCDPYNNHSGLGLYFSGPLLVTQMEAEGFRCLTFFSDRPDVMSRYKVRIIADRVKFPILLSNGNLVDSGLVAGGRHFACYIDPHAKPCYLFALVAGDLAKIEQEFITLNGRRVKLQIYSSRGNESRCKHALESLALALRWDEQVFGLEYDLDSYAVVAANDFNFAGMENKGLNIFNSSHVLADPESASDSDYADIERTIAHEAFHNYTGNRVTCRDWFQLTLKEGLTVFREQEFCGDRNSLALERLRAVEYLKEHQFPEDAGPNSHPIQPKKYIEIDNFYTPTVYNKGSEIIRMLQTLVGRETFNRSVRRYLKEFDGQAVTVQDFVGAVATTSNRNLQLFANWYDQAGTPELNVKCQYDPEGFVFELTLEQKLIGKDAADEVPSLNLHIPVTVGLVGEDGADIPLTLEGESCCASTSKVLELTSAKQVFRFVDVKAKPIPSLLRNFSAPVRVSYPYSDAELIHLMKFDSDRFNRWQAGQLLALKSLQALVIQRQANQAFNLGDDVVQAFAGFIDPESDDPSMLSMGLKLPSVAVLSDSLVAPDFDSSYAARKFFITTLAKTFENQFLATYQQLSSILRGPYSNSPLDAGRRLLKNTSLIYLGNLGTKEYFQRLRQQYSNACNMTDREFSLIGLASHSTIERDEVFADFLERWRTDPVVICVWWHWQAALMQDKVVERVAEIERAPIFDHMSPNHIRSLYGAFAGNLPQFHAIDGSGYTFLAERVLKVDSYNPNVAGSLAEYFHKFSKLDVERKRKMAEQLNIIVKHPGISKGVFEIVSKTLAS